MEYLYDYLAFLARAATIVVAIVAVVGIAMSLGARRSGGGTGGHLDVRKFNDRLDDMRHALQEASLFPPTFKKVFKEEQRRQLTRTTRAGASMSLISTVTCRRRRSSICAMRSRRF
jgi:serine protease SohB